MIRCRDRKTMERNFISVDISSEHDDLEVHKWIFENIGHLWATRGATYYFISDDNATLFKLTWG